MEKAFPMPPITLRGMTWSDPRGYDPLVAAARSFARDNPGVTITWDKRSLQGFESTPVDELAAHYDLMVIDHPHVGEIVTRGCLLDFARHAPPRTLDALRGQSVGRSYESYCYGGGQWALPIDAAAQVQAVRPDLLPHPVTRFADLLPLARDGKVLWPLRPPHVLMSFFTLGANIGAPCAVVPGELLPRPAGLRVLAAMQALADAVDPACHDMDPIAALDALAEGRRLALAPLVYLYATYARDGYRPAPIRFHDIPALGASGPLGSALGGTGIAISARSAHPATALRFALRVASAAHQRGPHATHNGQPGNGLAWSDEEVNATVNGAYAATRMTHEAAWLRPRHAGYMGFQEEGSHILADALRGRTGHEAALTALERRFNDSFA